jgi:transposase
MHERTNIQLSRADRSKLEAVVANRNSPQKHVWRAKIILLTADGRGTVEIMRATGKAKTVIWRWQERFRGPPQAASHWTGSAMAEAAGISVSSVQRIWRAHGLQPHRVRQFKLSNDPQFAAKLHEIVGLYVDPPDHAVVLSVDEKSQIQALDRTQPGLPMKKGRAGTVTHDYKRHGVTTLFAALNVLEGKVIGQCMKRHRHQEFIRFLNVIEARVPKKKTIHVIVDNYATHKHPDVMQWLDKHRRFVFHFTPTSASWLNAIEGFFAKLTKKRLKRGVFRSLRELKDAIHRFLDHTNANPKPFTWTKDPNKIIAAVRRGHQVLDSIH